MPEQTDEELATQYQQGSVSAFNELYRRFEQPIYSYLTHLAGRHRASDLFQEAFLQLHCKRSTYDPTRRFASWLFRIAHNCALNELRRSRRRSDLVANGADPEQQASPGRTPEQNLDASRQNEQLLAALAQLPVEQREAIALSYHSGLKYAQIAEVMDVSEDAVKQRVRRGLQALRRRLFAAYQQ